MSRINRLLLLFILLIASFISCSDPLPGDSPAQVTGMWGGEHIRMEAEADSALILFDCANGTIDEPIIPGNYDSFIVYGTYTIETGGPEYEGQQPDTHPAKYEGYVTDNLMTLVITLTDRNDVIGTFLLQYNNQGNVYRCLNR